MIDDVRHPILQAVNSILKFPTIEDLLCEGRTVSLTLFRETVGDRFVLPNRRLCASHVRGLADSISKHGEVVVPILIERTQDNKYIIVDGLHRLAALDLIKETSPSEAISARVKLRKQK